MTALLTHRLCLFSCALLISWPCLVYSAQNAAQGSTTSVLLALNPLPYRQSLQLNEARAIFTMRVKHWPDGSDITVFVLPDQNDLHQRFVKQVLQLLPHQLRRHWNRLVYTGIGRAPIAVSSEADMRQKLLTTPGSIGYLPHNTNTTGEVSDGLIYFSLE